MGAFYPRKRPTAEGFGLLDESPSERTTCSGRSPKWAGPFGLVTRELNCERRWWFGDAAALKNPGALDSWEHEGNRRGDQAPRRLKDFGSLDPAEQEVGPRCEGGSSPSHGMESLSLWRRNGGDEGVKALADLTHLSRDLGAKVRARTGLRHSPGPDNTSIVWGNTKKGTKGRASGWLERSGPGSPV